MSNKFKKMKNLVLSVSIGDRPWNTITLDSQRKYAALVGAEFKVVDEYTVPDDYNFKIGRDNNKTYLIKLLVIQDALKEYDRVFFLDDTCYVNPVTINIFEHIPYGMFAANNEGYLRWTLAGTQSRDLMRNAEMPGLIEPEDYFNTGVMLADKTHMPLFSKDHIQQLGKQGFFNNGYPEQTYLNAIVKLLHAPVYLLPSIWNRMAVNLEEYQGKRLNYHSWEPIEAGMAKALDIWQYLKPDHYKPGRENFAFIYHITSFHEKRLELIKHLAEMMPWKISLIDSKKTPQYAD